MDNQKEVDSLLEEARQMEERNTARLECNVEDVALSTWANDINARLNRAKAKLLLEGGVSNFPGLFKFEGNDSGGNPIVGKRVAAILIKTRFGTAWSLCNETTGEFIGKFISAHPKRESTMTKKGYIERDEIVGAGARIGGSGHGLSGVTSCCVQIYRTDGGYPGRPKQRF